MVGLHERETFSMTPLNFSLLSEREYAALTKQLTKVEFHFIFDVIHVSRFRSIAPFPFMVEKSENNELHVGRDGIDPRVECHETTLALLGNMSQMQGSIKACPEAYL